MSGIDEIITSPQLNLSSLVNHIDIALNKPGADTTECATGIVCLQFPQYIIDPAPLLYSDDGNINDNWTDVFNGVRFRFDNPDRTITAEINPDFDVIIKELNYSDTLLNQLLDIKFRFPDESPFELRPPYAYKIIFSTEPIDTAVLTLTAASEDNNSCGIYNTFFPFRIYNIITGEKVGLENPDKGVFNGCEDVPRGSDYACDDHDDWKKHPGAADCIWTRNEVVRLGEDLVTSAMGLDGLSGNDDHIPWDAFIYTLNIEFNLNSVEGYGLSNVWGSGNGYIEEAIVEYGGMLWQTNEAIEIGSDISKTEPSKPFLNESQINISPWKVLYPWQDGDSLIIVPERWYVDGDAWVADLSLLGKVNEITQSDLDKVKVVPNPYIVESSFRGGEDKSIRFAHLPTQCQIYIYTVSGEFVDHITHHDPADGNEFWDLKNGKGRDVAPGLYIYTVETLNNLKTFGKFAIVR